MVGLLSDRKIKEYIRKGILEIKPYDENNVGPASYDLRLGFRFRIFVPKNVDYIDVKNYKEDLIKVVEDENNVLEIYRYSQLITLKSNKSYFIIHPGELVLASIYEYIKLPPNIAAQIQGRSSIARLGLLVHTSAGWVDPGYEGNLTLEIVNLNRVPIKLYPLMKIAQLQFFELEEEVEIPYNKRKTSKYVKEKGATESKIHLDFK